MRLSAVVVFLCALAGGTRASAQVAAGAITGIVRDQTGAPVPGVTVTVTNVSTNVRRVTISSADGAYAATNLVPGVYRIEVALEGFKTIRRDSVQVATGNTVRLDFALALGELTEQIILIGQGPILREVASGLGTVVEHESVVQLPLNGRTFITLASLAPGVARPPNPHLPRINGGSPRTR